MNSEARWYKYYGNIPKHIDYPDISMYQMVKNASNGNEDRIAYDFMGKSVTYKTFLEEFIKQKRRFFEKNS